MADNADDKREEEAGIREQDRLLPIANVSRIMKKVLPPNAKLSKEAKETMQESVSEFVAFVTAEASDQCRRERRKTVNGDDVCSALAALGFDCYAPALRQYLRRFRDLEGERAAQEGGRAASIEAAEEAGGWFSASQPPHGRHYHNNHHQPPTAALVTDTASGSGASLSQMMGFSGVVERGSSSDSRRHF